MIFDKQIKGSGLVKGKNISIIKNTGTEITISVNGTIHIIKSAGKSAKELGEEIRNL